MEKVLYFEGAGWPGTGGPVGNCRIRTAFTNDAGKRFYLELNGHRYDKAQRKRIDPTGAFKNCEHIGWVDSWHEITEDPEIDDVNKSRHPMERKVHFLWTLEGIRNLINKGCGCSFDEVKIAPEFSGYRVFKGTVGAHRVPDDYNFGDQFEPDMEATAKVQAIHERECERQREAGEKYPCVSVLRDEQTPSIVHVCHYGKRGLRNFDEEI